MQENFITLLALSVGASFVQRTTGFGFGIFIMTVLPFIMPSYGEATTLSGLLALTTSAFTAYKLRKYLHWRKLIVILLTFFVISAISICVLKRIDDHMLRRILGVALILISLYFAFLSKRIQMPQTTGWQIGAGTLSGIMGGFFGMQGPPAVLYFINTNSTKEEYMAMAQTYFLCGNLLMTAVRAGNGFLTLAVGKGYLYGLLGVLIGMQIGNYVFQHLKNSIFKYVVYAYIAVSGIIILITT